MVDGQQNPMTKSDPTAPSPDPFDVALGKRLSRLRQAAGMSRQNLAEAASRIGQGTGDGSHRRRITAERVRKTETAESPCGPGPLLRMAAALGVPVTALLSDPPPPSGDNQDANEAKDPFRTPEGKAVFEAFLAIESEDLRHEVAALVRAIAGDKAPEKD